MDTEVKQQSNNKTPVKIPKYMVIKPLLNDI